MWSIHLHALVPIMLTLVAISSRHCSNVLDGSVNLDVGDDVAGLDDGRGNFWALVLATAQVERARRNRDSRCNRSNCAFSGDGEAW